MAIPAPLFMKRKPRQALVADPPPSQFDFGTRSHDYFNDSSWANRSFSADKQQSYNYGSQFYPLPPIHQQLRTSQASNCAPTDKSPYSLQHQPGFLPTPQGSKRISQSVGAEIAKISKANCHKFETHVLNTYVPERSSSYMGSAVLPVGNQTKQQHVVRNGLAQRLIPEATAISNTSINMTRKPAFLKTQESTKRMWPERDIIQKKVYTTSENPGNSKKRKNVSSLTNCIPASKQGKQTTIKKDTDNTLRLITATIEGMKYWSKYSSSLPLLFEVVGSLNSAVTTDVLDAHKCFQLKDDRDVVTCLFCEIDRGLPKLNRGQWYRCVGKYEGKSDPGVFRCVSVRLATDAEKNSRHNMVQICDKSMRAWVSQSGSKY